MYRLGSAAIYLFDQAVAAGELEIVSVQNNTTMTSVAASVGIPPTSERGVFILAQSYPAGGTAIATTFLNKAGNSETDPSLRATGRRTTGHSDSSNILEYVQCDASVDKKVQFRVSSSALLCIVDIVGFVDQLAEDGF